MPAVPRAWMPAVGIRVVRRIYGEAAAVKRLRGILERPVSVSLPVIKVGEPQPKWTGAAHMAKVEELRSAIAAGVCFQGNLTVPFAAVWPDDLAPGQIWHYFSRCASFPQRPMAHSGGNRRRAPSLVAVFVATRGMLPPRRC